MLAQRCCLCDKTFECGSGVSGGHCWCADYPALLPVDNKRECLCSDCLSVAVAESIEKKVSESSLEEMLTIARQHYSADQLIENIDYTIEGGRYVFSRWYHLKRGRCCGNGCRHCPF